MHINLLISLRLRCSIRPRLNFSRLDRSPQRLAMMFTASRLKKEVDVLKIIRVVMGALLAIGLSSVASAQSFNNRELFFGGGLSPNKLEGAKTGTGDQAFGG